MSWGPGFLRIFHPLFHGHFLGAPLSASERGRGWGSPHNQAPAGRGGVGALWMTLSSDRISIATIRFRLASSRKSVVSPCAQRTFVLLWACTEWIPLDIFMRSTSFYARIWCPAFYAAYSIPPASANGICSVIWISKTNSPPHVSCLMGHHPLNRTLITDPIQRPRPFSRVCVRKWVSFLHSNFNID